MQSKISSSAMRESEEEILLRQDVDIWTTLPPMETRDNSAYLTAVVGNLGRLSESAVAPNPQEVEQILVCSIQNLCKPANSGYTTFRFRSGIRMPVFRLRSDTSEIRIWGMTAIILHLVLRCLVPHAYFNDFISSVKAETDCLRDRLRYGYI